MNIAYRSESESNLMQRSAVTKRHLKVRICFKYPIFFRVPRADVIMFVKEEEKPSKCDDIRSSLLILIEYKSSICRKYISYPEFNIHL